MISKNEYPCPDPDCTRRNCSHTVSVESSIVEDKDGNCFYRAFCYTLMPPEEFSIPVDEYELYRTQNVGAATRQSASPISTPICDGTNDHPDQPSQSTPTLKGRGKGTSSYSGLIHSGIEVKPGKWIKAQGTIYHFTANSMWIIANRILDAIYNREEGCTIPFSKTDYNACKKEFRSFVDKWLERQRVSKRIRASKYTGLARFKFELLTQR